MISIDKSVVIKRPSTEVFAFVSNPDNIIKWRSDVAKIADYNGELKVGTSFREQVKGFGWFTMRIKAYESPKQEIIETTDGPQVRPTQTYTFVSVDGATEFRVHIDVQVDGFFKLLQPILPTMIKNNWSKYLSTLKQLLEQQS